MYETPEPERPRLRVSPHVLLAASGVAVSTIFATIASLAGATPAVSPAEQLPREDVVNRSTLSTAPRTTSPLSVSLTTTSESTTTTTEASATTTSRRTRVTTVTRPDGTTTTSVVLDGGENTLRLAFSGVTPDEIGEGISRLADAVRSLGVKA